MPSELTFQPMGRTVTTRQGPERVADVDPRLTRSHYFDSRLLTAEDLNRDQLYLDGRLRELGHALGHGVVRGLALSLDPLDYTLTLGPGVAVTRAGRVLEVSDELHVDLGDRALISELNQGLNRRFDRGLYAVILKYAELGTDVAEVFPRDLGDKRGHQYDVISEGSQLALVPLRHSLSLQNPLHLRANLLRAWGGDGSAGGAIPEDAVALGVVAISDDRPQWLDSELLRQPLRTEPGADDLQQDLSRRYERLFDDVMTERHAASLGSDFAASDYFQRLPPVGSIPRGAVDPAAGRQGFFPEHFNVWIAPVRRSDLELIRQESMRLPAIDLATHEALDIMVLTPLNNADYGHYTQRLLSNSDKPIPTLDPLRLRLRPRPVHALDTDAETWAAIWTRVEDADILYVRRPLRTAETHMSGIVLAQGVELPEPSEEPVSPADNDLLTLDEDGAFLNRLSLRHLIDTRRPVGDGAVEAAEAMRAAFADDAQVARLCALALMRIERVYDAVLWQTLFVLARQERLQPFLDDLMRAQPEFDTTAQAITEVFAREYQLGDDLVAQWAEIEAPR
jgi:hypothetical protein